MHQVIAPPAQTTVIAPPAQSVVMPAARHMTMNVCATRGLGKIFIFLSMFQGSIHVYDVLSMWAVTSCECFYLNKILKSNVFYIKTNIQNIP